MKITEFSHLNIRIVIDDELMNLKTSAFRDSLENHTRLILAT